MELAAAILGALSALLLAAPLIHEIKASKRFTKLKHQLEKHSSFKEIEEIKKQFVDEKFSAYTRFEVLTLIGVILLFLSFSLTVAVISHKI